jgi:hypothetical protein
MSQDCPRSKSNARNSKRYVRNMCQSDFLGKALPLLSRSKLIVDSVYRTLKQRIF